MKYQCHYYLSAESPLAKDSIQEESKASNGLSDISLCSSRSRAHRNSGSFGKHSRKNSQETELRKRKGGTADTSQRDSLTEDGNIVLDPSSILDEIMAKPFTDSEDEKSPPRGLPNGTASPSRPLFSRNKDSRPQVQEKREEDGIVSSRQRSSAMDTSSSPQLKSTAKLVSQRTVNESDALPETSEETPPNILLTKAQSVDRKQELRRSGSISKVDRRSGGSWNQLSGGKALGMFYHSRRSHLIEEGQEEQQPQAEKGPNDDTHPISPLATSTALEQTPDVKEPVNNTAGNEIEVRVL